MIEMIVVVIIIILLLLIAWFISYRYRQTGGYFHKVKLDAKSVKYINDMFKFVIDNDKSTFLQLLPSAT